MEVGIMDTIITDQQALDILTAMSDAVANNPELDDASPERISGFALEFVVNEVARLRDESLTFDPNLFELAKIILSDCGISENNQPLYDRVLSRLINARLPITTPTEQQILTATEKAGMWPNNVRKWIPVFHRYHAELAAMSYNQVGNSAILEQAIKLLKKAELEIDRHICPHDSTHRGGAIWEICDDCGAKWADDRGGKPEFKPNEVSEAIREFIKAHDYSSRLESPKAEQTEPKFDYTDVRLTKLIMSDCGVSTVNSQSLVERIASRISKHVAMQNGIHHNFYTHRRAWRKALELAEINGRRDRPDIDEKAYWRHELRAFDMAFDSLPPVKEVTG